MKQTFNSELERILKGIEFPGEDGNLLKESLVRRRLTDNIMHQIDELKTGVRKVYFWIAFAFINLALLSIFGTSRYIVKDLLALESTLAVFFFLFLGISFFGSLVGLIFNLDTSWFTAANLNNLRLSFLVKFRKIKGLFINNR